MAIRIPLDDVKTHCIVLGDRSKNSIIQGGHFVRLLYSTHLCTTVGMTIDVPLKLQAAAPKQDRLWCVFSVLDNLDVIGKIASIESQILSSVSQNNENHCTKLSKMLERGMVRMCFNDAEPQAGEDLKFLCRLSGIWENSGQVGITYKWTAEPINRPSTNT